jgi:hypothetical protein
MGIPHSPFRRGSARQNFKKHNKNIYIFIMHLTYIEQRRKMSLITSSLAGYAMGKWGEGGHR